ncbi:lycopene cyclase domain-containing protein [Galbibacter sp. PAP.153]|uniref:lycopene cyclase domain-containing protein n=1 Tax=Galbibacter sp. PAP.153 TaxID=3104623 RepID=UPI00300ADF2C
MERFLYLLLVTLSFVVPFLYSFEKKRLYFIKYWKPYFLSIIIAGLFFIAWDIYFTIAKVWGFNDTYLTGLTIFYLPVEEWLFFLLIPYASNFIHYALLFFFPSPRLGKVSARYVAYSLFVMALTITVFNSEKIYTFCSFGLFALLILLQIIYKFHSFNRYVLSFLVILIPFFIVNSWLTGLFTEMPIVYYNNEENLGIRLGAIPIEDIFYCFSLLYTSILLFEFFKKRPVKQKRA